MEYWSVRMMEPTPFQYSSTPNIPGTPAGPFLVDETGALPITCSLGGPSDNRFPEAGSHILTAGHVDRHQTDCLRRDGAFGVSRLTKVTYGIFRGLRFSPLTTTA